MSKRIAVLPDVQAKPGLDFRFLTSAGSYIAERRIPHIICMGDFADMPSLSSYDRGRKEFEGRRYRADVDAAKRAMDAFMEPIWKAKGYYPQMDMLLGNHENRIDRAISLQAEFEGVLSTEDLGYAEYGWEVHGFLRPLIVSDIAFSHYFVSGVMGRPVTTAAALLTKKHMSCIAGHQQGLQIATQTTADGRLITGVIAGSCYQHEEDYLGPQSNTHWRGMLMLNDVRPGGEFDLMPLSLRYLLGRAPSPRRRGRSLSAHGSVRV